MTISLETAVRTWDPETSHEAAQSITAEDLNIVERTILRILTSEPMADHELFKVYELTRALAPLPRVAPQRIRTIRKYLELAGFVEASGLYHLTDSGRRARVWQVTTP